MFTEKVFGFWEELSATTKRIILGQLILVLLCFGVLFGIKLEDRRVENDRLAQVDYGTTIAVVNMDEGVIIGGELVYYSETFINSLGTNFTVVSAQVARSGLENGTYGGIVYLPADMSKNIMSVSSENPITVVLPYEINNNLSEAKYINVFESISNLQKAISNSCSYLYVSSMMQELHTAQDTVKRIFENDQRDLDIINSMRNTNFMGGLTLEPMPEIKDNFQGMDFSAFEQHAQTFSATLVSNYIQYYNDDITEYIEHVETLTALSKKIQEDGTKYIADLTNAYNSMRASLQADKAALDNYYDDLVAVERYFRNRYDEWPPEVPSVSRPSLRSGPVSLPAPPQDWVAAVTEFNSIVTGFDPNDNNWYYMQAEAYLLMNQYQANIQMEINRYNQTYNDNLALMYENINNYSTYASGVYAEAMRQYAEDSANLQNALDELYNSKYKTSQETQQYLSEFESMLTDTRVDGILNREFVGFVVSPIEISGDPYRTGIDSRATWRANLITALLLICLLLSLSIVVMIFLSTRKINKEANVRESERVFSIIYK